MKKIFNFFKNNLLEIYIIFNVIYVFRCSLLFTIHRLSLEQFAHGYITLLIINSIIALIISIKKYSFHKVDLSILLIIIFGIISMIFAFNQKVSLYGCYGRYEGLYTIMYYLSLFYLSTFIKNKKFIIYAILVSGFIQFIYGICQYAGIFGVDQVAFLNQKWVTGFATNPNFYGSFMLLCLCLSIGLFIEEKDTVNSLFLLLFLCCFMSGLLFSNTLSCLVGLGLSMVVLLIYCLKNKKIIKYGIVVGSLSLVFLAMQLMNETTLLKDFITAKNETVSITKGKTEESFGSDRIYLWKKTIKFVPKYLYHGIGIDNFGYIDNGKPIFKKYPTITFTYDKAHNEYLQILVTTGIFSLLSYILFHVLVIVDGIKNGFKNHYIYLLLPVLGYLTHLMFSMNVIEVAPLFYITMGLAIIRKGKTHIYRDYIKRLLDIIISFIFIILLLPINILIALCIKIIDNDEVIFKQKRTGLNGKEFNIYKYRTVKNKKLTKLGKILRMTSLDELPQLINVLKGDMSIVGPRPWILDYYDNFTDYQKKRAEVRPGIVGLAQVKGRNELSIFEKINYDILYVDKVSLLLDLKILFSTIKVIFIKDDIDDMNKYIKNEIKELRKHNDLKLEVILSVLNLNKRKLNKMNITSNCTIINQCGKNKIEKDKNYNIYCYNEIGVANSRNRGLEHMHEDIVLLCDDDITYKSDYEEIVINEFRSNPDADMIIFNLDSKNRKIKTIKKNKRLHIYNCLGFAAGNIAFKRRSIIEKDIHFNTMFGPGGKYCHGEDTLFVVDSLKNKLKIYGVNKTIGSVENKKSTWFNDYDQKYFFDKGALYTCISKVFRRFLIIQYLLRHRSVLTKLNFKKAYKEMKKGSKDYLNNSRC